MRQFFKMDNYVETDLAGFQSADADEEEIFRPDGEEVSDEQSE